MKKVSKVVEEMLQEELLGNRIKESFDITRMQFGMMGESEDVMVSPVDVSKALKGIKHCLVGGYAIPVHTNNPRATKDVDMVVGDVEKAENAIEKAFPNLKKGEKGDEEVTRFYTQSGREVINLLHPISHFKVALDHAINAKILNHSMRVNSFESIFINKFISMNSRHRSPEGKARDQMDLISLLNSRPDKKRPIDFKKIDEILKKHPLKPADFIFCERGIRQFVYDTIKANEQRMKAIKESLAQGRRIPSF
jgi:hypothetical protein